MLRRRLLPLAAAPWADASLAGSRPGTAAAALRVDLSVSSGEQRSAWVRALLAVRQSLPDVTVTSSELEQEAYKRSFEARLRGGETDVAYWFAGERLRAAIGKGLIAPLDSPELLDSLRTVVSRPLLDAVTLNGRLWAMPLSHYPWGFLYRRSLFASWGLAPPRTWDEFLRLCAQLRRIGVTPTAVGARDGWPAAAWFDHLSLRLNGAETHRWLLANDPSLSSPAARRALLAWQELLRSGCFLQRTATQDWSSVLPYLYRGLIGMALMGSFAAARVPRPLRDDIGFFGFPATHLPVIVDAPVDVLVLPATSPRRDEAQRFLAAMARGRVLDDFARDTGELSPRLGVPAAGDAFLADAERVMGEAAGVSLFFDREARQDMVEPSFNRFRALLAPPHAL